MKKLLFLLLFSAVAFAQPADATAFENVVLTNNTATAASTKIVSQQPTTGELNYINATALPVSAPTQNALDMKLNISDLPTNLTLYPTTTASDVGGYVVMVTDIHDIRYNDPAVDVSTPTITTTDQLVSQRISDPGVLIGQPGVFNITTFGNIRRLSGTGTATFYFRVYHRDAAGVETLIGQSSNSAAVSSSSYMEFTASLNWDDGDFIATDRIVIKTYANRIPGNSDPVYQFQFGGSQPVRTLLPVPFSVVDAGYEVKTNKSDSYTASSSTTYASTKALVDGINIIKSGVSKNTSNVVYDDFDAPNQTLNGRISPSGQTWSVSGSGSATAVVDNGVFSATGNCYASLQYGAPVTYIGGVFSFVPHTGTDTSVIPQVVIIAQDSSLGLGNMLHYQLFWNGWSLEKRVLGVFTQIAAGAYTISTDGTKYRGAMRIVGNTVTVELPDGSEVSVTDSDISTLSMTAGTWQIVESNALAAASPRWHTTFIGAKKSNTLAVLNKGADVGDVTRITGKGFGKRNSTKFKITSDGWYRIAYNVVMDGYSIASNVKISTTGLSASHFEGVIFAQNGTMPNVKTLVNYGGYHLPNVKIGTTATGAFIDVQIQNTAGNNVELMIDAEGFVNLYPAIIPSPTAPTIEKIITIATQPVTTFNGIALSGGWNRIAIESSGPGGYIMQGTVKIKAWDIARSCSFDLLVSANASTPLTPLQIVNNSGMSLPIVAARISRGSGTLALDIYCPYAASNPMSLIAEYSGFMTPVASLAVASALTTEEIPSDIVVNSQDVKTINNYPVTDNTTVYTSLSDGASYTIPDNKTAMYQSSAALASLSVTLPANPVSNEVIRIGSLNGIAALSVIPSAGHSIVSGSPYNLPAGKDIAFKFRYSDSTWYLFGVTDDASKAPLTSPALTGTPTAPTAAVGTNTTQIATTAFVQSAVSSGTYTPTLTNTTNITSSTLNKAVYTRIGDIITVTVGYSATPTASGNCVITLPLPIARSVSTTIYAGSGQAILSGSIPPTIPIFGLINGSATDIAFNFAVTGTTDIAGVVTFQYSLN